MSLVAWARSTPQIFRAERADRVPATLADVTDAARHLVSLSFDDGFRASSIRTAEIFERRGLAASFNVIATGHHADFSSPDAYQDAIEKGDFGLWRDLAERGHEIMPHGYRHANKGELPFAEARDLVERCLEVFAAELPAFRAEEAVLGLPYNAASDELAAWLPSVVRAYRVGGDGINDMPDATLVRLSSTVFGPRNGNEAHFFAKIDELTARESGWLVYLLHGLGEEGYGPVSEDFLEEMLDALCEIDSVDLVTPARALARA
jgi:peptidoglycan/xylan/chitin deacetylase (PgdA/CDA1 family)